MEITIGVILLLLIGYIKYWADKEIIKDAIRETDKERMK